jgi:RNA polymerase primary sigma factor|tara:strand:+ start:197 stop:1075 length:879 start_codon:yes stop_codon:yes gene_type:complete
MKNTEKFELSTTYEPRSNEVTNLTRYLREMSEWDRISHDQEIELGKRVQAGDEEAVNELVKANLRLVLKIAKEYQNLGLEYMDLVSEGNLGLIRAAEKFDPEYGCRFSTLCAIWVRQFIRRALANQGRTVRLPVYLVDHIQKMRRAEIELNRRLKRPPMDEELAEATGMTLEKIQLMKRSQKASFSLDEDENEEVRSLHERLADENSPAPDVAATCDHDFAYIEKAMDILDEREYDIVRQRYGIGTGKNRSLGEIAKDYGLTRERIRQIQKTALNKLRSSLTLKDAALPMAA